MENLLVLFTDKTVEKADYLLERFLPCCARGVPTACVSGVRGGEATKQDLIILD